MRNPPGNREGRARRVVLVDFDWQDADLMPALLRRPDIHVQLVAGERAADPGPRAAEVCGVPHTLELADLTREIFDLALIGERSPRRHQVERLLTALGTPVASPQSFLNGGDALEAPSEVVEEHLHPAGVAAVPDPGVPAFAEPAPPGPATEDDVSDLLARMIPSLSESSRVAAAAIEDPAAGSERDPREERDEPALEETGAVPPAAEEPLGVETFRQGLEDATERVLRGQGCTLIRLRFDGPAECVAALYDRLPARLRAGDHLCRPAPREILLLCPGAQDTVPALRARMARLWEESWRASRAPGSAPPIAEDRIELTGPQEIERFLATGKRWLAIRASEPRPEEPDLRHPDWTEHRTPSVSRP